MRLTTPRSHASREVSFEYLNRQLVWHAFTEFLLFLLPLVGIGRWRRWITRAWRKASSAFKSDDDEEEDDNNKKKQGELGSLPERTCAICYRDQNPSTTTEQEVMMAASGSGGVVGSAQTDIVNPYETIPCGCIYCFVCIVQKLEGEEGEGWTCLRCGEIVTKCRPWNGDVLLEESNRNDKKRVSSSAKVVGFVMDDTVPSENIKEEEVEVEEEEVVEEKTSPLEEITKDESLFHSHEWSRVESESDSDGET